MKIMKEKAIKKTDTLYTIIPSICYTNLPEFYLTDCT